MPSTDPIQRILKARDRYAKSTQVNDERHSQFLLAIRDAYAAGHNLTEIGEALGVTRQRAQMLHQRALKMHGGAS